MRITRLWLAMLVLAPSALGAVPAGTPGTMTVPLCTGDGITRTISLPLGRHDAPGQGGPACCAKWCHAGGQRKRLLRRVGGTA